MDRNEIHTRVQNVFRDVFDLPTLQLLDSTSSEDIEDWDSLNHINLVTAIEKDFKIRFAISELQNLQNVGEMLDLIKEKLN
ncbi:MAG: acyl carrier protein [Proteobacteria bacterium]|nr:acyl carrier protein [Pseudomonadota bacterium]